MFLPLALGVAAAGCQRQPPPAEVPPAPPAAGDDKRAIPAAGVAPPATAGSHHEGSRAYVTQPTFVRRAPVDARDVAVTVNDSKRRQRNWLATLQRGEHVRVLAVEGDWLRVQSSDEADGWIKREGVLVGPQIAQATSLAELRRFSRPDLLALQATDPIPAGSLLFVLRSKDAFSEVNYAGNATTWVLRDALRQEAVEVEAAKLLHRARSLAERNDPAAEPLRALARSRFPTSRLVEAIFAPAPPPAIADDETASGGREDEAGGGSDVGGSGGAGQGGHDLIIGGFGEDEPAPVPSPAPSPSRAAPAGGEMAPAAP